ncbi:serine hydrolase [Paraburkholderia sp.]|uniref:serine hydrolase n=1 Tax=Paraburkholderia sp. TaxID=1926495 RepID=UPI003C7997DB
MQRGRAGAVLAREKWHYRFSTDVLGMLIARVAGCSFSAFLRTRIFEPLGMHDTGFIVPAQVVDRLTAVLCGSFRRGVNRCHARPGFESLWLPHAC